MSGATREQVLAAVRSGLGQRVVDAQKIRLEAASLLENPASIRPALAAGHLADVFANRAASPKVAATVERIDSAPGFPAAVAHYLGRHGLPRAIALQPERFLRLFDWSGFELHDQWAADEPVGVGIARWAIAETGSVVFHSSAETPILANFLPLHHVVLVRARAIVPYLEDYVAAFAATGEKPPRNVNLITGASGTTDIEGDLVRGAHGPRFLHLVVAAS